MKNRIKVSKTSGKEIKNGTGTVQARNLKLIVELNMTHDGQNFVGDGVWMDDQGNCFLGSYAKQSAEEDEQPIKPRKVTAIEALKWFGEHEEDSIDGSGWSAPLIRAALAEGNGALPEKLAVSPIEAAKLLSVSRTTIWRLCATGRLKRTSYGVIPVSEIKLHLEREIS